jgi:hypothetical protein
MQAAHQNARKISEFGGVRDLQIPHSTLIMIMDPARRERTHMMRTRDRQARAGGRLAILAALGLTAALLYLLLGELGATSGVPVYAASPLLPPNLLAPANGAVISDTTPTLS